MLKKYALLIATGFALCISMGTINAREIPKADIVAVEKFPDGGCLVFLSDGTTYESTNETVQNSVSG